MSLTSTHSNSESPRDRFLDLNVALDELEELDLEEHAPIFEKLVEELHITLESDRN